MASTLYQKIMTLYPNIPQTAFSDGTIILQNDWDGKGDYIAQWNDQVNAKPTAAQLAAIP